MRKGMAQGLARPALSDRNGTPKIFGYDVNTVAPHGGTTRWTYTVPAGRKFQIGGLIVGLVRDAVAAPIAQCYCVIQYTPSGGAQVDVMIVNGYVNAVGDAQRQTLNPASIMNAGDLITGSTADSSTGGSLHLNTAIFGTEGDA